MGCPQRTCRISLYQSSYQTKRLESNVTKAKQKYERATIKANTGASAKYKKLQTKADDYQRKSDKKNSGLFKNAEAAAKFQAKATKYQTKANKYKAAYDKRTTKAGDSKVRYIKAKKKAERWTRAMNKTFKNYKVSDLPEKQVNSGRDFLKSIK